ncbi:MAG: metalloregulator ArsR/SmtB family transcription factor [Gemmatimonadaceae bacterium]
MPEVADIAVVMRTLADPTRRGVFEQIVHSGEVTVGTLTRSSSVSQPAISQHVRALREAGLLDERRQGRNIYYRTRPNGLAPLVDWLEVYGVFWRERFANLVTLLEEIDHDS